MTTTTTASAAVWRRRGAASRREYTGPLGMAVWASPEGPQLIELHDHPHRRPVIKFVAQPSLRRALETFAEAFPDDGSAHAWDHPAPEAGTGLERVADELFTRPRNYQWHPQKAMETVTEPAVPAPQHRDVSPAAAESITLAGGRAYWPRPMGEFTDVEVLRRARGRLQTRIKGLPANGKTMLAEAAFGDDLIVVQGHGDLSVDDLVGRYLPNTDADGYSWHDGPLVRAMREGKVLLFDEVTRAPSDTVNALLSATDDRRMLVLDGRPDLPVVHAADGFHVVVTYNETGVGVRPLDPAVIRRFPLELEVTTDLNLVAALGVDERLISVASRLRQLEQRAIESGELGLWTPQTGHLLNAQNALELLGATGGAGVLLAACTEPQDRNTVAEVLTDVFGIDQPTLTQEAM